MRAWVQRISLMRTNWKWKTCWKVKDARNSKDWRKLNSRIDYQRTGTWKKTLGWETRKGAIDQTTYWATKENSTWKRWRVKKNYRSFQTRTWARMTLNWRSKSSSWGRMNQTWIRKVKVLRRTLKAVLKIRIHSFQRRWVFLERQGIIWCWLFICRKMIKWLRRWFPTVLW